LVNRGLDRDSPVLEVGDKTPKRPPKPKQPMLSTKPSA
jgi:hypothetical protein